MKYLLCIAMVVFCASCSSEGLELYEKCKLIDDVEKEIACHEKVIASNDACSVMKAYGILVVYYDAMQKKELAKEIAEKAIESTCATPGVYLSAGLLYSDTGENRKALDAFNKSLEKNPAQHYIYYEKAKIYFSEKDYKEALNQVEFSINQKENNYKAWALMGSVYRDMGNLSKAALAYKEAIKYVREKPQSLSNGFSRHMEDYYFSLASLYIDQNDMESARKTVEEGINVQPEGRSKRLMELKEKVFEAE